MVVVDVETTGLDPSKSSIIEIGAVDFYNPSNQFNERCRIRDGSIVNPLSLEINGYTLKELKYKNYQTEKELLKNFVSWIRKINKRTLAGQNVNFDLRFLNATIRRESIEWSFGRRIVDLHSMAFTHMESRGVIPPLKNGISNLNGNSVMKYVGIPPEPIPHRGINGAIYETEAFYRLMFNKNCFDQFRKYNLNFQ